MASSSTLEQVLDFYNFRDTNPEKVFPRAADGTVQKYDDMPRKYHANVDVTDPPFNRHPGDKPAMTDAGRGRHHRVPEDADRRLQGGELARLPAGCAPYRGLISAYFAIAFSNFRLNSHIAPRISRKLAELRARSALPKAKMLLLRRCFMMVGSDTL